MVDKLLDSHEWAAVSCGTGMIISGTTRVTRDEVLELLDIMRPGWSPSDYRVSPVIVEEREER
jgi:hypothetical protein